MNPIRWFVILALMAAACALEVFLAKRKSRWPGLVLPVLWFVYILLMTVAAVAGGLAGIYYGEDAIHAEWLRVIAKLDDIRTLCRDFCQTNDCIPRCAPSCGPWSAE